MRPHEQVHQQDWPQVHWKFGLFGIVLLFGLVSVVAYRLIKPWYYPLANITINLPGPPHENPNQSVQNRSTSQPPKITARLTPLQTSQQPVNPTPSNSPSMVPQTQLDRLILLNKNLSKGDRPVLSSRRYPSHSKQGNRRRKRLRNILSVCARGLGSVLFESKDDPIRLSPSLRVTMATAAGGCGPLSLTHRGSD
jgi:hypothetical protein